MNRTSPPPFEPLVSLPDDPYAAAWMYFGVMAYPELGAGLPDGSGFQFADSLRKFAIWATKKTKGRPYLREVFRDPTFNAPHRREFDGPIERGIRRVYRRLGAYDLVATQLINGFFRVRALGSEALREGRGSEAFYLMPNGQFGPARQELWQQATPTPQQLLRNSLDHWSKKFALNVTGNAADPNQKAKDLDRRAFQHSIPVLHLAHGISEGAREASKKIQGWRERNPILALVLNAELWVWDAVEAAEKWRLVSRHMPQDYLQPDRMVELKRS